MRTRIGALGVGLALAALPASAQTDYYNTDEGRPIRVEDASAVERYAFELQLAPLRMEREAGVYNWEVEPELAYGILPRTQVEIGFPLVLVEGHHGEAAEGLAGVAVAALHNLNSETRTLPAFAIAADVMLPVGGLAPDRAFPSVKGIATRTFPFARFHLNGRYTFGSDRGDTGEATRWMAGLAVDRTFPIRSLLITGDVFAEQPLDGDEELEWTAEAGLRYQTSPQTNVDLGVGRRLAGGDRTWYVTIGVAQAFAVRSLMTGR